MLGFRRLLASVAVLSAIGWLGSAPAFAAGNNDRQPLLPPPDIRGPFCGQALGDIIASVSVSREYIKTMSVRDGVVTYGVDGYQLGTFTVVATGKSVSVNGSGPAKIIDYPDGTEILMLYGHTLYVNPPSGGIFLYTGHVNVDATGQVTHPTGHSRDICAELA